MANPKSKKRRKVIIFLVLGLAVAGLVLAVVLQKREPVITIQTEKVTRRSLTETVVANGRIQPVLQVKISAEVSGEIIELPVKEGQRVKKGDLLVKIKPDVYVAQRNSAEASFLSAQSGLSLSAANLSKAEQEHQRNEGLSSQLDPASCFRKRLDIAQQVDEYRRELDHACNLGWYTHPPLFPHLCDDDDQRDDG